MEIRIGDGERLRAHRAGRLDDGFHYPVDLIVIDGNPAARIADIHKIKLVFKDGAGYDPAKLLDSIKGSAGIH